MTCVFDIETIPDFHLLSSTFGYEGTPLQIAQAAFKAQYEKSGSEFLPICFHRVISIASVICDEYGRFVKVGNFGNAFIESAFIESTPSVGVDSINEPTSRTFLDTLESTLLSEFWQFINKNNPKLVSFNGRGFDIPTMLLRAMRYNIGAWAYFEQKNPALNKSKWDNYRVRYCEDFHTDLYESLGHFGAARNLNLDALCKMLDLVGKYDMSGAQVYETYLGESISDKNTESTDIESKKAALEVINHYCHSDVLNTYWLYLKYEVLRGVLLESDYYALLEILHERLPKDKPYSQIFTATLKRHIADYARTNAQHVDSITLDSI